MNQEFQIVKKLLDKYKTLKEKYELLGSEYSELQEQCYEAVKRKDTALAEQKSEEQIRKWEEIVLVGEELNKFSPEQMSRAEQFVKDFEEYTKNQTTLDTIQGQKLGEIDKKVRREWNDIKEAIQIMKQESVKDTSFYEFQNSGQFEKTIDQDGKARLVESKSANRFNELVSHLIELRKTSQYKDDINQFGKNEAEEKIFAELNKIIISAKKAVEPLKNKPDIRIKKKTADGVVVWISPRYSNDFDKLTQMQARLKPKLNATQEKRRKGLITQNLSFPAEYTELKEKQEQLGERLLSNFKAIRNLDTKEVTKRGKQKSTEKVEQIYPTPEKPNQFLKTEQKIAFIQGKINVLIEKAKTTKGQTDYIKINENGDKMEFPKSLKGQLTKLRIEKSSLINQLESEQKTKETGIIPEANVETAKPLFSPVPDLVPIIKNNAVKAPEPLPVDHSKLPASTLKSEIITITLGSKITKKRKPKTPILDMFAKFKEKAPKYKVQLAAAALIVVIGLTSLASGIIGRNLINNQLLSSDYQHNNIQIVEAPEKEPIIGDILFEMPAEALDYEKENITPEAPVINNQASTSSVLEMGTIITIREETNIFENSYDAKDNNNPQNPYFESNAERRIMGVVFYLDGEIKNVSARQPGFEEEIALLEESGARVVGYKTSILGQEDLHEFEGFYRSEDIVLTNQMQNASGRRL